MKNNQILANNVLSTLSSNSISSKSSIKLIAPSNSNQDFIKSKIKKIQQNDINNVNLNESNTNNDDRKLKYN